MASALFDRHRVIDVDSHLTEPPDVWTARVSSKWGDRVPHIERLGAKDVWMVGGKPIGAPGAYSLAGFNGTIPEFPDTYAEIPASTYDPAERLRHLDAEGIWAQVLYPNVGGFGAQGFLHLEEPALMLECVQAYNDFLIDWTSAAPQRLVPVMATPFWDVPASAEDDLTRHTAAPIGLAVGVGDVLRPAGLLAVLLHQCLEHLLPGREAEAEERRLRIGQHRE